MTDAKTVSLAADLDADGPWQAWLAKNRRQNRITAQRMFVVAVLLGIGVTGSLVAAILFR